jgi:hypothetical protein
LGGAATVANAQEQALAALAKKITTEMQASATTLLGTSAAGTVNSAMPTMATITGTLRLRTGDVLPRANTSENQPATRQPTNPQKKELFQTRIVDFILVGEWRQHYRNDAFDLVCHTKFSIKVSGFTT